MAGRFPAMQSELAKRLLPPPFVTNARSCNSWRLFTLRFGSEIVFRRFLNSIKMANGLLLKGVSREPNLHRLDYCRVFLDHSKH